MAGGFLLAFGVDAKGIKIFPTLVEDYTEVNYDSETEPTPLCEHLGTCGDTIGNRHLFIYVRGACFDYYADWSGQIIPQDIDAFDLDIKLSTRNGNKRVKIRFPSNMLYQSLHNTSNPCLDGNSEACDQNFIKKYKLAAPSYDPNTPTKTFKVVRAPSGLSTDKDIKGGQAGYLVKGFPRINKVTGLDLDYLKEKSNGGFISTRIDPIYRYASRTFDKRSNTLNIQFGVSGGHPSCGPYKSPLMLFFSKKRPTFQNTSHFPIYKDFATRWPEASHPGYFLVQDRNNDKKITMSSEIFRNRFKVRNGFEDLRKFDSNKDQVIDSRDKNFSKLLLWKDKNGNGIGEASELIPLGKKNIRWISLRYKERLKQYGSLAEERQRAVFGYRDKKGKSRFGRVVDVWFAPYFIERKVSLKKK